MSIDHFREPKEINVADEKGNSKRFVISKMPYFAAREVLTQFPITAAPKLGDYRKNQELAQLMFQYVAVSHGAGKYEVLAIPELIENHCDVRQGMLLEKEMLEYNGAFLVGGEILDFLNTMLVKAEKLTSRISTGLLDALLQTIKQPSTSSKTSSPSKKSSKPGKRSK